MADRVDTFANVGGNVGTTDRANALEKTQVRQEKHSGMKKAHLLAAKGTNTPELGMDNVTKVAITMSVVVVGARP